VSRLFEPPEGQQVFQLSFAPTPAEIDANGHVNNVVYLSWAQDLATSHWEARQPPEDQARWLRSSLARWPGCAAPHQIGETARGRTWVAQEAEGPRFDRFVRIDGPDGAMCAQVRTTWCLIEREGGRPRRVPAEMVGRFIDPVPPPEG